MNARHHFKKKTFAPPEFETVADAEKVLKNHRVVDRLRAYREYLEERDLPGLEAYNQEALAERLGTVRENVSRTLCKMRREEPPRGGE